MRVQLSIALLLVVLCTRPAAAAAAGGLMRAPEPPCLVSGEEPPETSSVALALGGLLRLYQRRVSPTNPGRCGFSPSCSAYALEAIRDCGPLLGVVLIGDRLTRCNLWKREGAEYTLLPNGRLFDPVSYNVPAGRCADR